MTARTITVVTANLGRGVSLREYLENLRRLDVQVPKHAPRFYGLQEVDEADKPEEWPEIRRRFGDTHRFVGSKTAVPILVPRDGWRIHRRVVTFASAGVAHLSPHRHVVQAVVHPLERPELRAVHENTHFARNDPRLAKARADAGEVLTERTEHWSVKRGLPVWLTADINEARYRKIAPREDRFVSARLDIIRGYEPADRNPDFTLMDTGTVDLTIDGHNAHWARLRLDWD